MSRPSPSHVTSFRTKAGFSRSTPKQPTMRAKVGACPALYDSMFIHGDQRLESVSYSAFPHALSQYSHESPLNDPVPGSPGRTNSPRSRRAARPRDTLTLARARSARAARGRRCCTARAAHPLDHSTTRDMYGCVSVCVAHALRARV